MHAKSSSCASGNLKPLNTSHKNKTLGLVLKFQLYRVVYQDNLEKKKKKKLRNQNDGVFV